MPPPIDSSPKVSVGMPVRNGERLLSTAIESILNQTYLNIELIVSDNDSSDRTEEICRIYEQKDQRVLYFRQHENIGAWKNFQFVLSKAEGEFFMWSAVDDTRTKGFIEENLKLLLAEPDCVFSSAPNCFEGEESDSSAIKRYELDGSTFERLKGFFDICWQSHALFYSLARKEALSPVLDMNEEYLAVDWSVDVCLLRQGKFKRASSSLLVLGNSGTSKQPDHLRNMQKQFIERILPFSRFSKYFVNVILNAKELNAREKIILLTRVVIFNASNAVSRLKASLSTAGRALRRGID